MATKTVHTEEKVLGTLREMDCVTQAACEAITAMAKAARNMLELNASSLEHVAILLEEIEGRAQILMNDINCQAEHHGVNWIDERQRSFSDRLWKQHHKLHRAGEVKHG